MPSKPQPTETDTHGGAGRGQGRKHNKFGSNEVLHPRSVRLTDAQVAMLTDLGGTLSNGIHKLIQQHKTN